MKIIVAFDGTIHARKALVYGLERISETGGELTVIQIFDRRRFVDYDAGPAAEDLARREAVIHLREARQIVSEWNLPVPVAYLTTDGDAAEVLREHTETEQPDMLLLPPRYQAAADAVSCPVYRIPGTVLVPMDGSGSKVSTDKIVNETRTTGAKVLLLGIVPVHLYGREEKKELDGAVRATEAALQQEVRSLKEQGVEAQVLLAKGYPDQEIARIAGREKVSLIMLPGGGKIPSELAKAAAVLLDGPEKLPWPIWLAQEPNVADHTG